MTRPVSGGDARIAVLIRDLGLVPHPEGGHYAEVFRSSRAVEPEDRRGSRSALTTIYYLLAAGEVSRLHRVRSDEIWCHVEGSPLQLIRLDPVGGERRDVLLAPLTSEARPVAVVEAGWWQAARPAGAYALACCSVGPGFDFLDFELAAGDPGDRVSGRGGATAADGIVARHPDLFPFS